jgi:hypothetical protein
VVEKRTGEKARGQRNASLEARHAVKREDLIRDVSKTCVQENQHAKIIAKVGPMFGHSVKDAVDPDLHTRTGRITPAILHTVETPSGETTEPKHTGVKEEPRHDVPALGVVDDIVGI